MRLRQLRIIYSTALALAIAACSPVTPTGSKSITTQNEALTVSVRSLEKAGVLTELDRTDTVSGIDSNRDGIRDDVDRWIAAQPQPPEVIRAMRDYAKIEQLILTTESMSRKDIRKMIETEFRLRACLFEVNKNNLAITNALDSIIENTESRRIKSAKIDALLDGMALPTFYNRHPCE